jgi:preprotein translocase subunit SecG
MGAILVSFQPVILGFHFLLAILLIVTILLQPGKGDIGAAFGAGGSQSVFGVRGAGSFLSRITTVSALLFLLTSISLATISKFEAHGTADDASIEKALSTSPTDKPAEAAKPEATPVKP